MIRTLSTGLLALITCITVIGCATTQKLGTLKSGDYRLVALSETSKPLEIVVVMNFTPSYLTIAGQKNAWGAPVEKNIVGALVPLTRTQSNQVGAFERMFVNTIQGATIVTESDGYLIFRNNDIIVAVFEPMAP